MFAEPHLGFAKGPVLVAHQAEYGQQLWLRKLVLAETTAGARGNTALETCRAMRANGRSPTSAIAPPASIANKNSQELVIANSHGCSEDVNRAGWLVGNL